MIGNFTLPAGDYELVETGMLFKATTDGTIPTADLTLANAGTNGYINITFVKRYYVPGLVLFESNTPGIHPLVIQNNVRVGNGVILNPGVELHHDSIVDDNVLIYTNTVVRSLARVGRGAHLGSTLTIGNEVIIKEDSIIMDGMSIQKGDII